MSRQREWQKARRAVGGCIFCSNDATPGKRDCATCRERNAKRAREAYRIKHGIDLDAPIQHGRPPGVAVKFVTKAAKKSTKNNSNKKKP